MSVKWEVAKGASWLTFMQLTLRVISFASTLILARLLTPTDFGLVAMGMAVINFVEMLGDFGFGVYLIQKEILEKEDLNSAWTLQFGLSIIETVLIVLLAIPASQFFQEPRLKTLMLVLSINTLVSGVRNVALVEFQRELRFDVDFYIRVAAKLAGFLFTVILAYSLRNYWALVLGAVVFRCTDILVGYIVKPYRPKFQIVRWREIINFSKWLYANTTIEYLNAKIPEIVIGRISGSGALGLFSMGKSFTDLVGGELLTPVIRVFLPGGVKLRKDIEAFRQFYLQVFSILVFLGLPAGCGLSATANLLTPVLLGAKWTKAIPVIQILGISVAIGSAQANINAVFLAQGKPRITTVFDGIQFVFLFVFLLILTMQYGIMGSAVAVLMAQAITAVIRFSAIASTLRLQFCDFLRASWRAVLSTGLMYMAVKESFTVISAMGVDHFVALAIMICEGIICYSAVIFFLWYICGKPEGAETIIIKIIRKIFKKAFQLFD